jgi:hypothetical protein
MSTISNKNHAAELTKIVEADYANCFPGNNTANFVKTSRDACERIR